MATRPDQSSTGSPAAGASRSQSATHEQPDAALDLADDVGANEWLLEEMYERYRQDPNSVAPSWKEYFSSRNGHTTEAKPAAPAGTGAAPAGTGTASTRPGTAPSRPVTAPSKAPASAPDAGATITDRAAPEQKTTAADAQTAPAQPRARAARVEPPNQVKEARPNKPGGDGGLPADPPNPANRPSVAATEPSRTTLRGAPARTAKNMDLSLSVPTATSVRSLPVKLLIDQQIGRAHV